MALRIRKFPLSNLFSINWWKCAHKYFRGIIRYTKGQNTLSNDDFYWVLSNGSFKHIESLVHENLGINYACLKDFNKAEYYLLKSLEDNSQKYNSLLLMWLGYVFLIKERHEESLYYFRRAREFSDKGINKFLTQHKYVNESIDKLEESIREKYKDILTDN